MFCLNRNDTEKRQPRVYAVNKRAALSRVSLSSSSTSRSKRLTGSSSTITQESYSKLRERRRDARAKLQSTRGPRAYRPACKPKRDQGESGRIRRPMSIFFRTSSKISRTHLVHPPAGKQKEFALVKEHRSKTTRTRPRLRVSRVVCLILVFQ